MPPTQHKECVMRKILQLLLNPFCFIIVIVICVAIIIHMAPDTPEPHVLYEKGVIYAVNQGKVSEDPEGFLYECEA